MIHVSIHSDSYMHYENCIYILQVRTCDAEHIGHERGDIR